LDVCLRNLARSFDIGRSIVPQRDSRISGSDLHVHLRLLCSYIEVAS